MTDPTISVRGRASTAVEPDRLVLEFDLESGGERPGDARARAADCRRTLADAVSEAASTVSVDVAQTRVGETDWMFESDADADYAAGTTLEVHCRPDEFDAVVQAGSDAGAALESVTPVVGEPHRESVRRELVEAATERARLQATEAAAAADHAIVGLVELEAGSPDVLDSFDDEFTIEMQSDHVLGPVEVDVVVDVTYEVAPQ